jgi:hypothetical protein
MRKKAWTPQEYVKHHQFLELTSLEQTDGEKTNYKRNIKMSMYLGTKNANQCASF